MDVIEDPEGLLGQTRHFVATRRFAAEVWEGRRFALLQELRRQRDLAHEAMECGEADAAYQLLSGDTGFVAVAVQLWLEGAQQISSRKEQDGRLAEVTAAAGCPAAHALYRCTLAVEPERPYGPGVESPHPGPNAAADEETEREFDPADKGRYLSALSGLRDA